jgi:RNA polymerase sigma factor (TIGR02999 family)
MSDVTRILSQIEQGDPRAAEKLLPLVYDELRKLAAAKLAQEKPGQTLQATALVHDAYIRLVDVESAQRWDSRGHFFSAAAEAMRRILVENARRKQADIHGSGRKRVMLEEGDWFSQASPEEVVDLDDSLIKLATENPLAAEIVKLRVFAGLSLDEAAACIKVSRATAHRHWTYARAWLRAERVH